MNNLQVEIILIEPPDSLFNESFVLLTLTVSKTARGTVMTAGTSYINDNIRTQAKKPGAEETTVLLISLPGRLTTDNSTTPNPPITTVESTVEIHESCDTTDCKITIITLSIFLAAVTIGFLTTIILSFILRLR